VQQGRLHLGGRTQLALWMAEACARMSLSGHETGPLEKADRLDIAASTVVP